MEQRRRDHRDVACLVGNALQHPERRRQSGGSIPASALWRARRARGQQHRGDRFARQQRPRRAEAADVVDRPVRARDRARVRCVVGDHDVPIESRRLHDRRQIAVDHDRSHSLAKQHLTELWRGEAGVQVHARQARLRRGDRHLDEVAMVGAQHSEVIAAREAELPKPLRQRRRAPVEIAERHRAAMVDHRRPVPVAQRRSGVQRSEARPPPGQRRGGRRHLPRVEPAEPAGESHAVTDGHTPISHLVVQVSTQPGRSSCAVIERSPFFGDAPTVGSWGSPPETGDNERSTILRCGRRPSPSL